jgi:hypothetical protein
MASPVPTAAHLVDHVIPPLPVRQWVLSVPKRLRWYLEREPRALSAVLRILLRVIEAHLIQGSGAGARARLKAVSFIHRFGASLNRLFTTIAASSTGSSSRSRRPVMTRNPCTFAPRPS